MKKLIPIMISGSLLASLLLAGCSSSSETDQTAAVNNQANMSSADNTDAQQSQGNGNQQNGRPNMSMNFGKIKSVSDNMITIYTSEMPSPPAQGTGDTAGGDMQNGQAGTPPERPDSDQGAGNGAAPEGEMPQGEMPEGGGQGGRPQGGGMQQSFSEETTEITIDVDTKIVTVTFDNGTRQENAITIAELKADDIIQYTLKSDSNVAESITLSNGNPGGAAPDGNTSSS
jgi:outer membrane murein-binding lipoprotein Lpp